MRGTSELSLTPHSTLLALYLQGGRYCVTQRKRCAKRISSLGEETNTIFTPGVTMATTRRLYDTNQHSSPAWTVSTRAATLLLCRWHKTCMNLSEMRGSCHHAAPSQWTTRRGCFRGALFAQAASLQEKK